MPEIVYGVSGDTPIDQAVDIVRSAVMRQAAVHVEDAFI